MSSASPKRRLFAHVAEIAQALAHAHRLELLESLAQGERSVEALAAATGLAFANVSQHLQQLRRANLAAARRDGKRVFYRLAEGPVLQTLGALRALAESNLAEVRAVIDVYYRKLDAMEAVTPEDLMQRLRDGTSVILDVRPPEEYRQGHLPQALNITPGELEQRMGELPAGVEIIAYCRGAWCILSFEAVQKLRVHGFKARRLQDGFPEWKAAGYLVETGIAARQAKHHAGLKDTAP
jgi:rhodanese-related sulfurtransferase/DNA-binding transcriptional ArsR family regulator